MELEKLPLNTPMDAIFYALQAHLNGATGDALTLIPFDEGGRKLYAQAARMVIFAEQMLNYDTVKDPSKVGEVLRHAMVYQRAEDDANYACKVMRCLM
jgi:hypothetical protein